MIKTFMLWMFCETQESDKYFNLIFMYIFESSGAGEYKCILLLASLVFITLWP